MSGFVIIHITPAILFELSIHIHVYPNNWDIFLIGQELIHSRPGPFWIPCRGENTFCKEHINNLSQTGSDKIMLKYVADNISVFFMYGDFIAK